MDKEVALHQGVKSDRPKWKRKTDYMLTVIGYCVSLANLWRYPYICSRNGGGAFLIPFVLALIFCGLPLFSLEVALGQFSGKSALHIWSLCPLLKGLGVGMSLLSSLTCAYFTIALAWSIYYLVRSCSITLPWTTCNNWWNTHLCVESIVKGHHTGTNSSYSTNATHSDMHCSQCNISESLDTDILTREQLWSNSTFGHTAAEEFWQFNALGISSGIEEVGHVQWHLAVCLLASWIIVFCCVVRGIQSVGKVVYVTATIPYVLLVCLLVQGLMLPGGPEGALVYLTPDFEKLTDLQVWLEACLQVFYSLGPAWGGLITMASYNNFKNDCIKDSIIATFVSEGTSIFGGLVVFSVLGFLANRAGTSVTESVSSGPGLGYVSYPEALSHLPVPQLWSFLFFLMMVFLALDSIFTMIETVISAIIDEFPSVKKRRTLITAIYCFLSFLFGLTITTEGGMYIFQLVDWYFSPLFLLMAAILELTAVCWIYGMDRFSVDIELMTGRKPPIFFRIMWSYITPLLLVAILIAVISQYQPPSYGKYSYPSYAPVIGWCIAMVPLLPVVIVAVRELKNAKGSLLERFKHTLQPESSWCPSEPRYQVNYMTTNTEDEAV